MIVTKKNFPKKSENDILLREDLEELHENYRNKFDLWYTIDKSVQDGKFFKIFFIYNREVQR